MTPPRPPAKKSPPRSVAAAAGRRPPPRPVRPPQAARSPAEAQPLKPLDEAEIDALQALLDRLPESHDALDVMSLDGYLAGVLLQPEPVAEPRWLAHIVDVDGKAPPPGFDAARLQSLVRRRHAELAQAIAERDWFDPWVYELEDDADPSEVVMPWVAGFATAVDLFPALMDRFEDRLTEPLALLYRHLDPDDLEDAEALLAEIETLEPPETLDEAVEDLVRATLLIADVSRPQADAPRPAARPGQRPGPGRQGSGRPGPAGGRPPRR
ncbi:MAG: YecA family protein [Burkholderiaceae bacterium]|nr:YecA family protein [Burkholderiaceae bacterium]